MDVSEDVAKFMGPIVASDTKLLAECEAICKIYSISAEALKYKWEALTFSAHSRSDQTPTFSMESVASLKALLQRDLQKQAKKAPRKTPVALAAGINRMRLPFARPGPTQVKTETTNESLPGPSKVSFIGPENDASSKKKRAYHYMYEKISTRSEALDDRIDDFAEIVGQHYNIADFGELSSTSGEEVVIVGRINRDAEISDSSAKLTDATITIESSRMHSSGYRLPLRFEPNLRIRGGIQGAGGIGLFPGAMVAVKGKNGGAGFFLASEIYTLPPSPSDISSIKSDPTMTPFSICIACGPFTPDAPIAEADLNYGPWQKFLQSINSSKPDVVLLVGPFLDSSHLMLKAGDVDSTPSEIFERKIIKPLQNFLNSSPGSMALLVPSVRDIISTHNVYPQPEFVTETTTRDNRIWCLPNPTTFKINQVKFAVTSVDVVFHLRKEELVRRGEDVDPIPSSAEDSGTDPNGNLCRHLLQQRSFYPIFPVPYDVTSEVNLDISHAEGLKLTDENNCAPDVLVVPSRLKHFAKIVYSTMAINPSFITKGSYSLLNVNPTSRTLGERFEADMIKLEL